LTEELLAAKPAKVISVEIDRNLAILLRRRFADDGRFGLIEGDVLCSKHRLNAELLAAMAQWKGRPIKLVANLPYNIASPLVIELLIAGAQTLVFTVQKEVAERIRAGAGTEAYGPLSVMVQLLAEVEWLRVLPPQAFWPAPKIQSVLLRLNRNDRLGDRAGNFSRFIHGIFSARRKMMRNSLTTAGVSAAAVNRLKIDGRKRPEEFAPEELLSLFEAVSVSAAGEAGG
jgi:16S rRNA (adenine1518-N6/adenine1519-N6)-dimethyltransferase